MTDVCIIGAGPAGLMAASFLSHKGYSVLIADAMPSFGRKFLMAGKSGLNLTKDEPFDNFRNAYGLASDWLHPMLSDFNNTDVVEWAKSLGQEIFTGSSGRVFPKSMKASPLLRAWLRKLANDGITYKTHWRWQGWENDDLIFETPDGPHKIKPKTTILTLGGASWPKLGSDGQWTQIIEKEGISITPFQPANMGFNVSWSPHMIPYFGHPIKTVILTAQNKSVKGDFVISNYGIEGSAVYAISKELRQHPNLTIDLLPDTSVEQLKKRLETVPRKASKSTILRKVFRLNPVKIALTNELTRGILINQLPEKLKALPIILDGPRPITEAISTAGGIARNELTDNLMLIKKPSVFCAGEMLDWEAPTGGYLITACLATGLRAGKGVVNYLERNAITR